MIWFSFSILRQHRPLSTSQQSSPVPWGWGGIMTFKRGDTRHVECRFSMFSAEQW